MGKFSVVIDAQRAEFYVADYAVVPEGRIVTAVRATFIYPPQVLATPRESFAVVGISGDILIRELPPADGVAVVNADDSFAAYFIERLHDRRVLRFAIDVDADVQARNIRIDADGSRFLLVSPQGDTEVLLPMPGRHNVANALAAASMAIAVGASLAQVRAGLESVQPVAGRLVEDRQQQRLHRGLAVAAGDRQHASVAQALHRTGERSQRQRRIGDDHLRCVDVEFARDQRGHAAAIDRRAHMVMAVELFASQRDEQRIAARQRARVGPMLPSLILRVVAISV